MTTPICLGCKKLMAEVAEEVDIGVGVQRFVSGWQCDACGEGISACGVCGAPENTPHASWCGPLEMPDAMGPQ